MPIGHLTWRLEESHRVRNSFPSFDLFILWMKGPENGFVGLDAFGMEKLVVCGFQRQCLFCAPGCYMYLCLCLYLHSYMSVSFRWAVFWMESCRFGGWWLHLLVFVFVFVYLCVFVFAFIHESICEMGCLLNGELQVWLLSVAPACYKGCAPACLTSSSALSTPELRPARSVGRVHLASISIMLKFVSPVKTDDAFSSGAFVKWNFVWMKLSNILENYPKCDPGKIVTTQTVKSD